jgi:hypothetical protein
VLQRGFVKGKEKVEYFVPGGEDAQSSVAKEVIKIGNNYVVMGNCFKGRRILQQAQPMVPRQQWRAKAVSEALKETRVEAVEERGATDAEVPVETEENQFDRPPTRLDQ